MKSSERTRFDSLYKRHLRALKLHGMSDSTMDVYARAVRRITQSYDCCPDRLTTEQLEAHFAELVESHSWSTVKVERNGLQFFWKHVLKRDWSWVEMIKVPKVQSLPDTLTPAEVERLIGATRKLRYRVVSVNYSCRPVDLIVGDQGTSTTQCTTGWKASRRHSVRGSRKVRLLPEPNWSARRADSRRAMSRSACRDVGRRKGCLRSRAPPLIVTASLCRQVFGQNRKLPARKATSSRTLLAFATSI